MAIGHEQMEVEHAALAPGSSVLDWRTVAHRRLGSSRWRRLLPTRVSTGDHHYINWVGEDSTHLLGLHTYRYGIPDGPSVGQKGERSGRLRAWAGLSFLAMEETKIVERSN
jgi:hypothetical protein